jgi:hypothetical protein
MHAIFVVGRSFAAGLIVIALSCLPSVARGQITDVANTTTTPIPGAGHDYIKMLSETVNPADGSVNLSISAPVPSARQFTVPFSFTYNSNGVHFPSAVNGQLLWNYAFHGSSNPNELGGGWSFSFPSLGSVDAQLSTTTGKAETCYYQSGYVFEDAAGTRHPLGLLHALKNSIVNCETYFSVDEVDSAAEGPYQATINSLGTVTVAGPSGTVYNFPTGAGYASIEDRNGNVDSSSTIDDLGRPLSITQTGAFPSSVSIAGLASPYTIAPTSVSPDFTVKSTVLNPTGCLSTFELGGVNDQSQTTMASLTLPNGQEYQFQYDPVYGLEANGFKKSVAGDVTIYTKGTCNTRCIPRRSQPAARPLR